MKQLLLLFILYCLTCSVYAQGDTTSLQTASERSQDTVKHSRIFISAGVAFLTGEMSKEDFVFSEILAAKPGASITVGFVQDLHKYFAVGISVNRIVYKVDTEGYQTHYNNTLHDYVELIEITSDAWQTTSTFLDVYGQFPFKRATFYIKGQIGITHLVHPEQYRRYRYTTGEDNQVTYQVRTTDRTTAWASALGISGGIRFPLGKLAIGVESGIQFTKKTFDLQGLWDIDPEPRVYWSSREFFPIITSLQLSYRLN